MANARTSSFPPVRPATRVCTTRPLRCGWPVVVNFAVFFGPVGGRRGLVLTGIVWNLVYSLLLFKIALLGVSRVPVAGLRRGICVVRHRTGPHV